MLIVTYHAIEGPVSPISCPPEQLEADLKALRAARFLFVTLDDCADWLAGRRDLPERSIAVTFDDAYKSVVVNGLPILSRLSVPATVYVIGARIGGDNQWAGQWKSLPPMPLADLTDLRLLAQNGFVLGSHSWSHPRLPALDQSEAEAEIVASADRLAGVLGTRVDHFAYPYGMRGTREVAMARRRFRTAATTDVRTVKRPSDPHDLCRIDCHDLRLALRLNLVEGGALDQYLAVRRTLRTARRAIDGSRGRT